MAALETSSATSAPLEVGQSPNAFFVNVTQCKATAAAAAALLCPVPTHSHINCLLICCSTSKNSIPWEPLPKKKKRRSETGELSVQAEARQYLGRAK